MRIGKSTCAVRSKWLERQSSSNYFLRLGRGFALSDSTRPKRLLWEEMIQRYKDVLKTQNKTNISSGILLLNFHPLRSDLGCLKTETSQHVWKEPVWIEFTKFQKPFYGRGSGWGGMQYENTGLASFGCVRKTTSYLPAQFLCSLHHWRVSRVPVSKVAA